MIKNKIGKTKFLFGNNSRISTDSFFKHTYDIIENILRQEFLFDNILIDIVKISNEKFILDYVNFSNLEKCSSRYKISFIGCNQSNYERRK